MPTTDFTMADQIAEVNPGALLADGLDDALIGYGGQFNQLVAVYSTPRVLEIF